mmetsp:Transcript_30536/g.88656  ORF Transcript_30536/g.88656 Transcript_30536/m.88656 type:complete len:211 (+) Transcript_30536:111-743(+)
MAHSREPNLELKPHPTPEETASRVRPTTVLYGDIARREGRKARGVACCTPERVCETRTPITTGADLEFGLYPSPHRCYFTCTALNALRVHSPSGLHTLALLQRQLLRREHAVFKPDRQTTPDQQVSNEGRDRRGARAVQRVECQVRSPGEQVCQHKGAERSAVQGVEDNRRWRRHSQALDGEKGRQQGAAAGEDEEAVCKVPEAARRRLD